MANNPYVNKVIYDDQTIIDISDTTAVADDVTAGKYFYAANGAKTLGTAEEANYILTYDELSSAGRAKAGTAKARTPNYVPNGTVEYTESNVCEVTSANLDVGHTGNELRIYGIKLVTLSRPVVSSIDGFSGTGVRFKIEKEATE